MPIRVYIVEDHPVMRDTLTDYLSMSPDIEVCGTAASAEEAAVELDTAMPDMVLLDLSLPGRSGLELLSDIMAGEAYPCLILSGHGEHGYVERALASGARGYILKGRPDEVPLAIRRVANGEIYLSEALRHAFDREVFEMGT